MALGGLVVSQESGTGAASRTAYVQGSSRPASGRVSDYLPSIFPWPYACKFISSDLFCGFKYSPSPHNITMLTPWGNLPVDHTNLRWMNFSPSSHPHCPSSGKVVFHGKNWCLGLGKGEKMQKELVGGPSKTQAFNFTILPRLCEHSFWGGWNHNFQCQSCSQLFLWWMTLVRVF